MYTKYFKYSLVLFFAVLTINVLANDGVTITIQNQYNSKLKNITVQLLPSNESVTTNDKGEISFVPTAVNSLVITAEQHETQTIAVASIAADNIVSIHKIFSWKDLLTPMFYIINGGLWLLLFIVFAETGLFAGFFLPGDSLLFVAGIYSSELVKSIMPPVNEFVDLGILLVLISIAGIIGNFTGYWFGKKIGPAMFSWKDNLLFKQKYLLQAQEFYNQHGGGAIIVARFLPIVRTFAPIVAGIVQMDKKKFGFFNVVGCIAWVASMLVAGHFLQKWILNQFNFDLKDHLEVIVLGIVLVTTAPVIFKLIFGKTKKDN
jgi:membrane-associated protein